MSYKNQMEAFAAVTSLFLLTLPSVYPAMSWPRLVPQCDVAEDVNACTVRIGTSAIQALANGDPDSNIPPIDPLILPSYDINTTLSASSRLYLNLGETNITGLKNAKLIASRIDIVKKHDEWDLQIPEVNIQALYNATGTLGLFKLNDTGLATGRLDKVNLTLAFNSKTVQRNGIEYLEVEDMQVDYTIGRLYLVFSGASPELNANLDDNWELVHNRLSPFVKRHLAAFFSTFFNGFLAVVPYSAIFTNASLEPQ